MFRFFKKKNPPPAKPTQPEVAPPADEPRLADAPAPQQAPVEPAPVVPSVPVAPTRDTAPDAPPVDGAEVQVPSDVASTTPDATPETAVSSPPAVDVAASIPAVSPVVPAVAAPLVSNPVADTSASEAATDIVPAESGTDAAASQTVAPPSEEPARKKSWLGRLKQGLARTGQSLGSLFVGVKVDENLFEELESALIMADAGIEATEKLLTALRTRVRKERIEDAAKVKVALRELLADHLRPLERTFDVHRAQPLVVMIAGVNGAGKTTSIGKLAHDFQRQGASVLLAAGDTFRAAAREQLIEWGSRNNVSVIAQDGGDPAAVAFDAVNAGRARNTGVVMVDTAGRLPTQLHLMEELKKIRRVIGKADSAAPHEVLLVVDGNTGQNVLAQIRAFDAAINLTGLVVTKLDGTAKGGTLAAVAAGSNGVRPVPVYWIGVGEGMEDLQPFVADEFAGALLAD